jgi:hypothetical protein
LISFTALEDELFTVHDVVRERQRESVCKIYSEFGDAESGKRLDDVKPIHKHIMPRPDLIVNFYFRFQFNFFFFSFFFARSLLPMKRNKQKKNFHLTFNDLLALLDAFFSLLIAWEFLA